MAQAPATTTTAATVKYGEQAHQAGWRAQSLSDGLGVGVSPIKPAQRQKTGYSCTLPIHT